MINRSVSILGTRGYPSYYGGFETAVRRIAPFLASQGWRVRVYSRAAATRLDDPARDPRVDVTLLPGIERRSLSTLTYGLLSTLHALVWKPDVALVMNVANGYWLPLLKLRGISTVVNVDGIEWEREKWGRLARVVFRIGAAMTARFADELVFDSVEIERYWEREFGRTGTYIPYGGDTEVIGTSPLPAGVQPNRYALMVARFVPENTVAEFFDAAEQLSQRYPVVVVGSSGYGGHLEARARQLHDTRENFHWLGHLADDDLLHSLWAKAGAYFHGHSVGGTNPALVQAMACGAPTVARDTPYNREVLGTAGVFVSPEPASIASALDAMLNSPDTQADHARKARKRAETHFDWATVCQTYEDLLRAATVGNEADPGAHSRPES